MENSFIDKILQITSAGKSKIALIDACKKISFSELEKQSRMLAQLIISKKPGNNPSVLITLDDCADYVVAQLGVWLAGGAIVPLNASYPKDRIEAIREQTKASLIIDKELMAEVQNHEPISEHIAHSSSDNFAIFFTSGSTGVPKGIVHTIDCWSNGIERSAPLGCSSEDVYMCNLPFYFVAQFITFPYLLSGATIHIIPAEMRRDMQLLPSYIEKSGGTSVFISPSVLPYFKSKSTTLRQVITGSERLSNVAPDGYELIVLYGMSETLPLGLYFNVDKAYDNTPIGQPFPSIKIKLLDDKGCEVPKGEEGEICLEGVFTKGYLNQDKATEDLYKYGILHTGDIGRQLDDGMYIYVNRKDWMLKINGQRVEPGEVEAVIKQVENIDNAIVKGFETEGKAFLCAYYIGAVDIEQLKAQISQKLPSYMLPSYFVEMEVFPVNQNGKIDRKSLKAPMLNDIQEEYLAPSSEEEQLLCEAFQLIFNIEKVGVNDDFFALGGDSIRIMKLQTIVAEMNLNSQIIFKGRTPKEIAMLCKENEAIEPEVLDYYPLSKTQMGIYVECANRKGEICYNLPRLFTLSKKVDMNRLASAVESVVAAHRYMLTTLKIDDNGDVCQKREDIAFFKPTVEEIQSIERVASGLVCPFDLDTDRLFRIRLLSAPQNNYLFIDIHHIIFDGSSFEVFVRDLNKAYNGDLLMPEEFSGFDIALLEEKRRASKEYGEAKQWHEKSYDGVDVDSLPITDQKESVHGFGKEMLLTTTTLSDISAFCASNKISENVFFNTAFSYLLTAYNSTNEALYTTVYNGRNDARSFNTIAMMVKTLIVYQNISEIKSIKELMCSVRDQLLGAMNNDLFSFAEASDKFGVTSNLLFAYQGDLNSDTTLCGEPMLMEDLLENATGETISLQVFKKDGHYSLVCEFKSELYTNRLIQEFLLSFDTVISELLVKEKLADISLVGESQLLELDSFNQTEMEYDKSLTVVDLIQNRAEEAPDSVAVVYKENSYTYSQLEQISNNIAGYLINEGLQREDVVAVLIPRSEYMAIAPLGVVKACCAYQPLDHTYPPERLEFMLEDSSAKLLIADEALLDLVPNYQGKVLLIKDIPLLPNASAPSVINNSCNAFNLLYTSGSTGLPKGCIIEHKNIAAFVHTCKNIYGLTPEDNTTAYASFGFDASMWETFMSLCWGCTLHIIAEDIRLNLIDLEAYFVKNSITVSFMTTQVGRQFALGVGETKLRHFSTGGEKLVALDPPKGFTLHNCYGPTEATVFVTRYPLARKESNIPIGKIVNNMKSYIVNSYGQRQPIGGIGELWVAGEQVARGYLNRTETTESVFITNPFSVDKSYERVYRTGDIVRYLEDGNIEFIGRRDAQVKIRGFRIELSEVESIIREFSAVKDATVQAYDMDGGGKYIAAFIVGDAPIDIEALREFVLDNKPPYILPSVIMQIDAIPLNQNQKVNKRALPNPEMNVSATEDDSADANRPLNILEEEIKNIVLSITNTENIGLTTKFAYAGVTSISSIKLATLLYKRFDINVDTKKLSREYSILDVENLILAEVLAGKKERKSNSEVKAEKIKDCYPLSYSQLGVYYECMKNPTKTTYNIPLYLTYPKSIDAQKIIDAVAHIIDINPYLLTRFGTQNTEIVQRIAKEDYTIKHLKLEGEELELFKQNYVQPYNLHKDTLFRVACVESSDFNYLFLDFHHLIFDGASCDLFIRELNLLLEGKLLEMNHYSYFNYIDNEKAKESTSDYQDNAAYFASRLQQCEGGTMIPADLNQDADYANLASVEAVVESNKVDDFCKSNGVSPAEFYLAAASYTISRYANTKDVYLSTISNGRSDIRTASTYGMMVKTLPIASFIREQTVGKYIAETASDFGNTLKHENYPYAQLATDYNFSPEIMYAYQVGVLNEYKVGDKRINYSSLGLTTPKFKLSIHIESRDNRDCIVLEYNDALYSRDLMELFAQSFNSVISNFIADTDKHVKHISILSSEQAKELDSFRTTAEEKNHIAYYHSGLEHYATTMPDHRALIATDASYSYGELNAEINKLANSLIARGVNIGDRVALLLPRTSRLIISMYGVSKTGAAYIPCDVEYPKERIAHVLEDSNASCIITTKDRVKEFDAAIAIDVEELLKNDNSENPIVDISVDDLCYIIYTSGSTGKPKGVLLQHKGISNYVYNHPANSHVYALVKDATRYLSVTTISFDMSLKEIATTLYNGLTLILANEDQANNPILLAKLLESSEADAFNATPSRMLQYMELDAFCQVLARCKIIMSGGEKFSNKLLLRLKEVTKARIFNTYGPTEITVSSNAKEMTNKSVTSIGAPLLNYIEFVVDSDGNELPRGVVGELYIGGIGVALGYNNLEKMTDERFITYKGIRVYRSGDYASWDKEGNVLIHGRTDNQVKLRGLRIELGEIETSIAKFDGIKNVVVIIKEIKGKEHIAAYFVADKEIDVSVLKDEVSKTLTAYMIPTAYLQMDRLPQTPNGKTDIKVLPEANLLANYGGEEAANDLEQTFCDMFAEILELDKVGATDSFFEIGGSSLIATRLIIEASKCGYEIAYGEVFENPTPRELALLVGGEVVKDDNEFEEIKNFDYSILNAVLNANTLENFKKGEFKEIKNVLLTGATGFLGIHILKELIDKKDVSVYCLLRGKDGITAMQRLKTMLFYYFEKSYEELVGKRLFVINAELSKDTVVELDNIDTVINCAAIVKHFAEGTAIYDVNVGGTNALIEFCLKHGARLIHISTMSVNGFAVSPTLPCPLKEQDLYLDQYINNKYIHSKFIAERNILENIATKGLDAKIMRVGNLSARNSDGEFQINFNTNSFMNRLKVFNILGVCPYEELDSLVEFSPIDEVAKTIMLLSRTPKECCIFHPYNNHTIFKGDIFNQMSHLGVKVKPDEMSAYLAQIDALKSDVDKAKNLTSIIAYENMGNGKKIVSNIKHNSYTMQVLYRLEYRWPVTSWDYIERFVEVLLGFGYFNNR